MQIPALLARIGYTGSIQPTLSCLCDLQRAFLLSVPFENLDIHLGREIPLGHDAAYAKIVGERRGGFCYECNGLFAELLRRIGFDVKTCSARMTVGGTVGQEYGHMVLVVDLDGPYLVDVGNGQSCREPMPLDGSVTSEAEGIQYRVGPCEGGPFALYLRRPETEWETRFLFSTQARALNEFAEMCRWHQTSPETMFTQNRLVTLAYEDGRAILLNRSLSVQRNGESEARTIDTAAEYADCLRTMFGIYLPASLPLS